VSVSFNKFDDFVAALGRGVHDLTTAQLMVALCAAASPPVAGNSVLTDLTQISYTNLSSRIITVTSWSQTAGLAKLICVDKVLTASGGPVATFRYAALYNNTATLKNLIGWYDKGQNVTLDDGETFTFDFDAVAGVFDLQ